MVTSIIALVILGPYTLAVELELLGQHLTGIVQPSALRLKVKIQNHNLLGKALAVLLVLLHATLHCLLRIDSLVHLTSLHVIFAPTKWFLSTT